MQVGLRQRFSLLIAISLIIGALFAPIPGYGQGRGHGYGRDKKASKFINRHDARDGRWDGRGPRTRIRRISGYDRIYYRDRSWRKNKYKGKKVRGVYRYRGY